MDVFEKLEEFYKQHSGLKGQPATEEQIHEAEKILDAQFNKQYI
ncbi:SMI1/KNR4 family protein, partial [Listeria seeligeri]|nr:SMI1/KNR4 family protein [Listeria seeligeri]